MRIVAVEEAFSAPDLSISGVQPPAFGMRPEYLRDWGRRLADLTELRLADMDAHGVDVQVLSLTVPGIQAVPDPAIAVKDARSANDFLAGVVAGHPTRFAGLAALPLQDPVAAAAELERAVTDLGFSGALVNDHTQGHFLDEPQYRVIWEALERLRVPLY